VLASRYPHTPTRNQKAGHQKCSTYTTLAQSTFQKFTQHIIPTQLRHDDRGGHRRKQWTRERRVIDAVHDKQNSGGSVLTSIWRITERVQSGAATVIVLAEVLGMESRFIRRSG